MPVDTIKPLSFFIIPPQARKDLGTDEELDDLGESLLKDGQLQNVGALETGLVIFGFRRIESARRKGMKELKVTLYPADTPETKILSLRAIENLLHKQLTEQEQFATCVELMTLNPQWKRQDLAAHLRKSPAWVTQTLAVQDVIDPVRAAFLANEINRSKVYEISKASPEDQAALLAVKGTRDDVAREGRKRRNDNSDQVRVEKIKVPLVSGATVTISGEAISMEEAREAVLEAAKQLKGAIANGITAKTAQRYWRDLAKAGG